MNPETTRAMQEALEAAVTRLNNGNGKKPDPEPQGPTDPISMLVSVLPKLLGKGGDQEELLEKVEELQNTDVKALREQVQILRKQVHRVAQAQEQILAELRQLAKLQALGNDTMLVLAEQMQRLEIVDEPPDQPSGARRTAPAPGSRERGGAGHEQQRRSRRPGKE